MATITLYAGKVNAIPGLIKDLKSSVKDLESDLGTMKKKMQAVDSAVCNLDDVISSITAAAQTEERRVDTLASFAEKCKDFIDDVVRADEAVADAVDEGKDDFYSRYNYLKPNSEKSGWEKFCDGVGKVCDWCKEHWKLIVTVVLVIAAVVVVVFTAGAALGPIAAILVAAAKGLIVGAITGGLIGGLSSMMSGGSFLEGLENGAFSGALMGGLFGGLGGLGQLVGQGIKCVNALGKTIKVLSKVSSALSLLMGGFDTLAFGAGLMNPDSLLVQFNKFLHSSKLYNAIQIGVSALAVFTGSAAKSMTCFVAGTMVLTIGGLTAIENIRVGDQVISAAPETGEVACKRVEETFVHTETELVHVAVGGEELVTTHNHPFYVKGRGFVNAGKLNVGDELVSARGEIVKISALAFETAPDDTKVYNFQVEEFHTYFVGSSIVLVHNAECTVTFSNDSGLDQKEYKQQLSDQQDGLNDLTLEDYTNNRQRYQSQGRAPESVKYQNAARSQAISDMTESLMESNPNLTYEQALQEATNWAQGKAALHGPDQIAGGFADRITGLGDAKINSSIGSQWKGNIGIVDDYVNGLMQKIPPDQWGSVHLDVELILK